MADDIYANEYYDSNYDVYVNADENNASAGDYCASAKQNAKCQSRH